MSKIPAPDDLIGGRYRVVKLIGEGGMGAVYEAENVVTKKRVALKWLHPSIADRPEYAQRLIREAQAASRVRHPNVVDVYDVITSDKTIFLVLELLEGEPLYELLDRGGMKVPQFIGLLIQAMRGVAAAHHHGIIHRDVHPGNIFLERLPDSGIVVKVLDFGISKIAGEAATPLTQSGTTIGTPLYMSYEQLCANRDLDARADVYSFGVILYRALAGRHPFQAESLTDLAVKFATTKPESVKLLRPEVPTGLDRIVMACIAREREHRPGTLDQLVAELEPFASDDGFRALLSGRSRQVPLVVGRPATRLHEDGAWLIPPTDASVIPATPSQMRAVTPRPTSAPAEAHPAMATRVSKGPSWLLAAAVGTAVAALTGTGLMLVLDRSEPEASTPPPAPPLVPTPHRQVPPTEPASHPAEDKHLAEEKARELPTGVATPPALEGKGTGKAAPPAKAKIGGGPRAKVLPTPPSPPPQTQLPVKPPPVETKEDLNGHRVRHLPTSDDFIDKK